jgi:hypothetical protein
VSLHAALWSLRRTLGLSPTQRLFRELAARGVRLAELHALEVFAHSGFLHARDYFARVAHLEAWEIDPGQEAALRRNLPGAALKITDSFQEIRQTPRRFGLILIDAPEQVFGDRGQYCEHFDMLPEVFRAAADDAVLIFNVMPHAGNPRRRRFTAAHLEARRRFYMSDHPAQIPFAEMLPVYRRIIESRGFELEWYFTRPRTRDGRLIYFALKVRRRGAPPPRCTGPVRELDFPRDE